MKLIIPLCFILLTSYAYGKASVLQGHGVQIASITQPVTLWKRPSALAQQQAAVLAMVYNVTEENADSWKEW